MHAQATLTSHAAACDSTSLASTAPNGDYDVHSHTQGALPAHVSFAAPRLGLLDDAIPPGTQTTHPCWGVCNQCYPDDCKECVCACGVSSCRWSMPLRRCACAACSADCAAAGAPPGSPRLGLPSPVGSPGSRGNASVADGGSVSCGGGVKCSSRAATTPWNDPNAFPTTSTERSITADTPAAVYGPCAASTMPARDACRELHGRFTLRRCDHEPGPAAPATITQLQRRGVRNGSTVRERPDLTLPPSG